jgi:nucleotide-binding universal stress UspA family protein
MERIFHDVICAVDDSDAGRYAAALAARVADPEGSLALVSVEDTSIAVHAGWQMAAVSEQIAGHARAALERGREIAGREHPTTERLRRGEPVGLILEEIDRRRAGLVVVGTHGFSRALGIALRSVATHMLHEASCSVLIAREPRILERWPRKIVAGVDGSDEAAAAAIAARQLAIRFGAEVRIVAASGDHVDLPAARRVACDLEVLPGKAVDELVVLSEFADLVVVGSRGLKGVRALGSVSERVAHQARCPVLVVRAP